MYVISYTDAKQKYIKVYTTCSEKFKTYQGLRIILPYGSLMQATYKAKINLSLLVSTRGKTEHIFPQIQAEALLSIGRIRDDVCTATFTATNMIVQKQVEVVIEGTCKVAAGMW